MSKTMEIGPYSAYAIAVKYGYTGTEEQWVKEQEANRVASEQAAQQAELAWEGAEAAATRAESAADRAESAQQATESAKTDALTVIGTNKQDALNAVQEAQSGAVKAVSAAETAATEAVQAAQDTATGAVSDAQTTAVKAVDAKGKEALANISTGIDVSLSVSGKAADAKVTGDKIGELKEDTVALQKRQNVLVGSETGNPVSCDDAFAAPLCGLTVYGKSTQDGTPSPDNPVPIVSAGDGGTVAVKVTGKNLLNISKNTTLNAYGLTWTFADGLVTISGTVPENMKYPRINLSELNGKLTLPAGRYKIIVLKHGEVNSAFLPKLLSSKLNNPAGKDVYLSSDKILTLESNYTFEQLILSASLSGTAVDAAYEIMVVNVDTIGADPTSYEPYHEQLLTLPTPSGLPGIPVTSGGNYMDANGQKWITDEINFEKGVKTQNIQTVDLSELRILSTSVIGTMKQIALLLSQAARGYNVKSFCNRLTYKGSYSEDSAHFYVDNTTIFIFIPVSAENPAKDEYTVMYALASPIEIPLTDTEIAAYKALTTYAPTTIVQANDGAGIKLDYQRDVNLVVKNLEDAIASMTTT